VVTAATIIAQWERLTVRQKGGADATVNSRTHCLILVDRFRGPNNT